MSQLNNVETTVTIAGNKCHFVKLTLDQGFNRHHTFDVEVNYEELDSKWMENPTKIIKMIGEDVSITMKHRETGEQNLFNGIITNVSMVGRHGEQNNFIISGCSPTIKLDGQKTMDSFMDKPLSLVAQEAIANSGNGASVTVSPVYGSSLDYICQYNETAFEFLNRLSYMYGEWFFYDGSTTYFGKPGPAGTEDVIYDIDMTHFNLSANMIPAKFKRYNYMHHMDKEMVSPAPDTVSGVRGYLKVALDKSNSVYTSDANSPVDAFVLSKKDLDDVVKAEKSMTVANMLVFTGSSHTCKVKIGGVANIKLPKTIRTTVKDVDTFLITEIRHEVSQEGYYSNTFRGILDGIENIPMEPVAMPVANPQIATVMDNADDKGRIKVQFQWQKDNNKSTNWIRVQTPDAGKSDDVPANRGQVFIPEVGDIVMVGFEYGDPDRPFSMGSIFSELLSQGGGDQNFIKTIITRSGHTIRFDDTKGKEKIQIHDIKGNIVEIDTKEDTINMSSNNVINITAAKTINMSAVDINLSAKNAINSNAGVAFLASAGATSSLSGGVSTFINAGKEATIKAGKTLSTNAGKNTMIATGMNSQMSMDNKGNAAIKAKKKVDVSSNEKVNIVGSKETKVSSKQMKIEGKTKTSVKGSKVHVG